MNSIQIITNEHYDDDVCTFFKNENTLLVSQRIKAKLEENDGVALEEIEIKYRVIEIEDPKQFVFAKKPECGPSLINDFIPICVRYQDLITPIDGQTI